MQPFPDPDENETQQRHRIKAQHSQASRKEAAVAQGGGSIMWGSQCQGQGVNAACLPGPRLENDAMTMP